MKTHFIPPSRLLFGPGPSPVHEQVLNAMSRPTIGHLDPAFIAMMDEIKDSLRNVFRTNNALTFPVSGPGTAGQQAAISNVLESGDTFIACINGVFGERMAQMAERVGARVVRFQQPWGRAIDPQALRELLQQHRSAKMVGFVHAETSTGALSDAKTLADIVHETDALVLADTVTSLGGMPVETDQWGLDICYSGTQKCLAVPPGLSPVTINQRTFETISKRRTPVPDWLLDMTLLTGYWQENNQGRSYHHTAPINALYGLHEGLLMLEEEGLENVWQRHWQVHAAFVAGIEAMGLEMAVPAEEQAVSINTVRIPDGVSDAAVRQQLLVGHGIEISGGLGPMAGKIWRIGTMGQGAHIEHVSRFLDALESVLTTQGVVVKKGQAVAAAKAAY